MNRHIAFVLFIFGVFLAGCQSPSILTGGENTRVRYQQIEFPTGTPTLELMLVEEKNKEFSGIYNEERSDANIKRVPPDHFLQLVQFIEDLGFVEMARPMPKGSTPRLVDASKALIVENDAGMWVVSNHVDHLTPSQRKNFYLMLDQFLNCFDSVFSLQVIQNKGGKDFFTEEQRRLQEANKNNKKRSK